MLNNYTDISFALEHYHELFYRFWQLGRPIFTDTIPTAGVSYNNQNDYVVFLFNPDFYKSLTPDKLAFVIAHECLHVTMNHCERFKNVNPILKDIANVAADVVVNETLVTGFGFNKYDKLCDSDPPDNICWINTVFKDIPNVERNREFEYYYNLLLDNTTIIQVGGKGKGGVPGSGGVDCHDAYSDIDDGTIEKVADKLGETLSNEAKRSLKSACQGKLAGTLGGNLKIKINCAATINRKWESVIKNWAVKATRDDVEEEQWARIARRMSGIKTDMFIPSVMEEESYERDKIDVWFFQDTSGSCYNFADRFFKAAKSLPLDKFNIRLFCFDTKVYETSLKTGELYGFGGTRFDIIETAIQREIREKEIKYPQAVFLITDGCGGPVTPQYPKKWYWFLSSDYKEYIPKESNVYMLKDFE